MVLTTNVTTTANHRASIQALVDISRSALYAFAVYIRLYAYIRVCCHSNETPAPNTNPPNSAQLDGTPTIPPS